MIKKELIAHRDPKSPVSETFRTLRTNIQFMNSNKKLETLLVTSTMPGEGKSWVASNLAVTFAQAGKRVILIDADMRKVDNIAYLEYYQDQDYQIIFQEWKMAKQYALVRIYKNIGNSKLMCNASRKHTTKPF